jgi:oleandomycin transport system permease protein
MPSWLAAFVNVSPVSAAAQVMRALLLGGGPGNSAVELVLWCAGLLLAFFPLSLVLYRRRT